MEDIKGMKVKEIRPAAAHMSPVRPSGARRTAQIRLPDGREYEAPVGTSLEDYVRVAFRDVAAPVVAGIVNGRLRELTYAVAHDAALEPVTMASEDGMRIYRRSLSFLMV